MLGCSQSKQPVSLSIGTRALFAAELIIPNRFSHLRTARCGHRRFRIRVGTLDEVMYFEHVWLEGLSMLPICVIVYLRCKTVELNAGRTASTTLGWHLVPGLHWPRWFMHGLRSRLNICWIFSTVDDGHEITDFGAREEWCGRVDQRLGRSLGSTWPGNDDRRRCSF